MDRFHLTGEVNCIYYVSSRCRTWRPAKTLLIFAPDSVASDPAALEAFAVNAGWQEAAEQDGAVLILPLTRKGWAAEDTALVKKLYKIVWKDTTSPDPRENLRPVWCWETLIFAVGYGEGAAFVGNAAIAHPNAFAQAAVVGEARLSFGPGEELSDRWLLPDASPAWAPRNKEVPVDVWFLGSDPGKTGEYFIQPPKVTPGDFGPDKATTQCLMAEFSTRIRWKNSPDGTPARLKPKALMDTDGEYTRHSVSHNAYDYPYYVRLPQGVSDAAHMPVVVCMHGHGEPAWMFAQKNGWPELQDETKDFVFVSPDSPEHTWMVERDEGMHEKMLDALERDYGIDRSRVYLTGFSNGSMATCWYATRHPRLYAAMAPWNSPILSFEKEMLDDGWQMPIFAINGDLDHKMDAPRRSYPRLFKSFLRANSCAAQPGSNPMGWEADEVRTGENHYTREAGYPQGHRLTTWVCYDQDGVPMTCFTSVLDMPHGAIHDEARATWAFLRHFSRPEGSRQVVYQ